MGPRACPGPLLSAAAGSAPPVEHHPATRSPRVDKKKASLRAPPTKNKKMQRKVHLAGVRSRSAGGAPLLLLTLSGSVSARAALRAAAANRSASAALASARSFACQEAVTFQGRLPATTFFSFQHDNISRSFACHNFCFSARTQRLLRSQGRVFQGMRPVAHGAGRHCDSDVRVVGACD